MRSDKLVTVKFRRDGERRYQYKELVIPSVRKIYSYLMLDPDIDDVEILSVQILPDID